MLRPSRTVRAALAVAVVAGAFALLAHAFAGIDFKAATRAVEGVGPFAPLVLFPFLGGMLFDASGQRLVLRALGRDMALAPLFAMRVATEALHLTAPAGFLVADTVTASLLNEHFAVPVAQGAIVAVGRKWLVMRAHAIYIGLGALLGASALSVVSGRGLRTGWIPFVLCGMALVPLGLSTLLGAGFRRGGAVVWVEGALARVPRLGRRTASAAWTDSARAADESMARIGAARATTWAATASFLTAWMCESLDTAVILALVGARFDLSFALGAEVGISMLRSVGNVAPAGLGVQDAGYATLLPAMGVPVELAAAFVLIKRAKELAWIAFGYGLLAVIRRPESRLVSFLAQPADQNRTPHPARSGSPAPPRPASSEVV